MGLRVFERPSGGIFLEITAPELETETALFVPAVTESELTVKNPEEARFVAITFGGSRRFVPYLFIVTRKKGEVAWKQIGELEQTDSINILNHLVDVLAYPSPNRG